LAGAGFSADLGTDIARFGGRARNVKSRLDYGEHSLTEGAAFGRLNWSARDGTRASAGFRYHRHSLYGPIYVPEFSAARRLGERLSISAAAAKGFRNPTVRELYLFPAPNPLLKPEHVWNYQATLQARPHETLTAWTTFYYADLKNLIVTEGRFPNLRLTNAGAALNRGVELNGRWRPRRQLAFNTGYAWLRSTNLAPYLPAHKLNYSLDADLGRAIVNLGGMTTGRRWADAAHTRQTAEYTVLTLRLTAPIGRRLSLLALIDNPLGRRYEILPGYPMPGANAMGGFTLRF
jgi:outer membrane receptor protein involved in Fe transport